MAFKLYLKQCAVFSHGHASVYLRQSLSLFRSSQVATHRVPSRQARLDSAAVTSGNDAVQHHQRSHHRQHRITRAVMKPRRAKNYSLLVLILKAKPLRIRKHPSLPKIPLPSLIQSGWEPYPPKQVPMLSLLSCLIVITHITSFTEDWFPTSTRIIASRVFDAQPNCSRVVVAKCMKCSSDQLLPNIWPMFSYW